MSLEELATPLLSKDGCCSEPSVDEEFFSVATDEENTQVSSGNDNVDDEAQGTRQLDQESNEVVIENSSASSIAYKIFHTPLFPENRELDLQLRFLKFLFVTVIGVVFTHYTALWMNWEHREGLRLLDIWLYEGNSILLDCLAFFSVGRIYSQSLSVDHAAWILVACASSLFTSILPQFKFLQHSVTLYELHCTWPWQLWCFVFVLVLPVCVAVVVLHIRHASCQQYDRLGHKLVEMSCALVLFLLPQIWNPSFHFHHWFAGFLFGMHANYDTWFSRATMSWCWGQYINGLAVWGRDPTLTCAYAYYISKRLACTSEQCLNEFDDADHGYDPPDWRHCSL